MRNIIPIEKLNLFSPAVIASMGLAFEAAWTSLVEAGSVAAAPFRAKQTRESLALFIIDRVREGTSDTARPNSDALGHCIAPHSTARSGPYEYAALGR